jgi:hypothetical protein
MRYFCFPHSEVFRDFTAKALSRKGTLKKLFARLCGENKKALPLIGAPIR